MSVVIEPKDVDKFIQYCHEESIEVTHVANVTDTNRLKMFYNGEVIVNLSRDFIDSAGAKHYTKVRIAAVEERDPFVREVEGATLREKVVANLQDDNVVSQRGMIEMFDSTIGASTVLMPFGGKTQNTETQVSVQKLPVGVGYTNTASIMAFGYNPFITSWSPYHGAAYAVVEAAAKVVAAGARYDKMRWSYQEYFERMNGETSWGKPLAALLGALKMQVEMGWPSIGGKDSMSGTFQDINVPPMLMAFGITTVDARTVISPEFKAAGHKLYLVKHTPLANYMPDTECLKANFDFVSSAIEQGKVVAGYAIGFGGVQEAVSKMSFGNKVGADVRMDEQSLFNYAYGSILVEAVEELEFPAAELIGTTIQGDKVIFNGGWDSYGHHNEPDATEDEVRAEVRRIIDAYCDDGRFIIYGGILIDTSNGWDRFNEMNGWVFDETQRYSSEMLRKKFG
jgi:phosphoribosylformylglycinamidine synthase